MTNINLALFGIFVLCLVTIGGVSQGFGEETALSGTNDTYQTLGDISRVKEKVSKYVDSLTMDTLQQSTMNGVLYLQIPLEDTTIEPSPLMMQTGGGAKGGPGAGGLGAGRSKCGSGSAWCRDPGNEKACMCLPTPCTSC